VLVVLGLGNPGREYAATRHNAGYRVLDVLAAEAGAEFARRRFESLVAEISLEGRKVLLCKPQTYMNLSGRAARAVLDFYKLDNPAMLVVCDDFNLRRGRLRVRRGGSAGGHKGLDSIIGQLGSPDFPRMRLGIGAAPGGATDHVLGRFTAEEQADVSELVQRAAAAVRCWVLEGIDACMNRFNASPAGEADLPNGDHEEQRRN
jgi:PTH1 family peptidyl-tRNA hydrolase